MKVLKIAGSLLLATVAACGSGAGPESEAASGSTTQPLWSATASSLYNQTAADVAVVTRGQNLQDMLRIDGGKLKLMSWTGNTWVESTALANPPGVASLKQLNAVVNGGRLDVFAVGSDKHIWHSSAPATLGVPSLSSWIADVPQNPTVMTSSSGLTFSSVAAVSTGAGNLNLFWWTPSGNIGHAWWDNNVAGPNNIESGDGNGLLTFKPEHPVTSPPDLSAVAVGGAIHLVYPMFPAGFAPTLGHVWFDGVSWGNPNRENFVIYKDGLSLYASSVSITSTGPNNLEIFLRAQRTDSVTDWHLYHTSFNGQWNSFSLGGGVTALLFEDVSHSGTAVPDQICTAIPWQSPSPRMDLWGTGNGFVWQAVRPL